MSACDSRVQRAAPPSALPTDRVPSLDEVSARLEPITGFRYVPAAGLVPLRKFYGSLAERMFHSTQYVRHPAVPLYTPEPDIIHEVIGHGHLLATPTFAELHRLAGVAAKRLRATRPRLPERVFWFSLEFGVVVRGRRAARLRRRDPVVATARSTSSATWSIGRWTSSRWGRPTTTSPTTSRSSTCAESIAEIVEVVGGFFETCTDESIEELRP